MHVSTAGVCVCVSSRRYKCRQVSELGIRLVKWQQCSGRYSGSDSIPVAGRQSAAVWRDSAYLTNLQEHNYQFGGENGC